MNTPGPVDKKNNSKNNNVIKRRNIVENQVIKVEKWKDLRKRER